MKITCRECEQSIYYTKGYGGRHGCCKLIEGSYIHPINFHTEVLVDCPNNFEAKVFEVQHLKDFTEAIKAFKEGEIVGIRHKDWEKKSTRKYTWVKLKEGDQIYIINDDYKMLEIPYHYDDIQIISSKRERGIWYEDVCESNYVVFKEVIN